MNSKSYQVVGGNTAAPFTLKIHRGDGMVLLAMNWRQGRPPRDFVGFAIDYREPGSDKFWPLKNRLRFPSASPPAKDGRYPSNIAPFQKFRWVHFPSNAKRSGNFTYRVTAMFMDDNGNLSAGATQTASLALHRETLPGKLNVTYTRGYVSSQAFAGRFAVNGSLAGLIPNKSAEGLAFEANHPKADEAYDWMGFEARDEVLSLLDQAKAKRAEVRIIAYDLNLPEVLKRLKALGKRLKIIIDNSGDHGDENAPESQAARILMTSAGADNVVRQDMSNMQHHKSIAVRGGGLNKVVYGSTNFTWRGFYVQSNNAVIISGKGAADQYFDAFDSYFSAEKTRDYQRSDAAQGWQDLQAPGVVGKISFAPQAKGQGVLDSIGKDIAKAKSSVFFSLAFLGQMTKGPIGPALGKAIKSSKVHTLGIADARIDADNLGVTVLSADNKRRLVSPNALTKNVPPPFSTEVTGLAGNSGNHRGTRMHHKFVVIDFDTDDARVYFGSHNFSETAETKNGENLLMIKDRTVATSFMVEAIRIYDHYRFRTVMAGKKKGQSHEVTLKKPPALATDQPWWQRDWDDPIRRRDRELFA